MLGKQLAKSLNAESCSSSTYFQVPSLVKATEDVVCPIKQVLNCGLDNSFSVISPPTFNWYVKPVWLHRLLTVANDPNHDMKKLSGLVGHIYQPLTVTNKDSQVIHTVEDTKNFSFLFPFHVGNRGAPFPSLSHL